MPVIIDEMESTVGQDVAPPRQDAGSSEQQEASRQTQLIRIIEDLILVERRRMRLKAD